MGGMMDPVLGEGHPNDESALAALSHPQADEGTANNEGGDESALAALSHPQANEGTANNQGGNVISAQAAETEVQAEAEAAREAEASSQPQTANQEGGKAVFETDAEAEAEANQASNDVSTETQELQNIMTEEGQVESSEKAGLQEVHNLLHKLG